MNIWMDTATWGSFKENIFKEKYKVSFSSILID